MMRLRGSKETGKQRSQFSVLFPSGSSAGASLDKTQQKASQQRARWYCLLRSISTQKRHRWRIYPQEKQQVTSQWRMFAMTTVQDGWNCCQGIGPAWGWEPWIYRGPYQCRPVIISWRAQQSRHKHREMGWLGWPRVGVFRQVGSTVGVRESALERPVMDNEV